MSQEVIETGADLQQAGRRTFRQDLVCCQRDKRLPVWGWDHSLVCDFLTIFPKLSESTADGSCQEKHPLLCVDGLEHK